MASFKNLLVPSGKAFFDLFETVTSNIVKMSGLFVHVAHNREQHIPEALIKSMEDLEHTNDQATHQLFTQLSRNFITPFDREDIHELASTLDDIADYIWGTTKQMQNYKLSHPGATTEAFAQQFTKISKNLEHAIKELRDPASFPGLSVLCREINILLRTAGHLIDDALIRVFSSEKDVRSVIIMTDHYEMLHTIVRKTSVAVKTIEVVVVKYG